MASVQEILVGGGVAAILAAVVGGGLKAFGTEIPLVSSARRQAGLMLVGVAFVAGGLLTSLPPAVEPVRTRDHPKLPKPAEPADRQTLQVDAGENGVGFSLTYPASWYVVESMGTTSIRPRARQTADQPDVEFFYGTFEAVGFADHINALPEADPGREHLEETFDKFMNPTNAPFYRRIWKSDREVLVQSDLSDTPARSDDMDLPVFENEREGVYSKNIYIFARDYNIPQSAWTFSFVELRCEAPIEQKDDASPLCDDIYKTLVVDMPGYFGD